MGGVTPAKGDFLVGERDQSVVGDGYAMGVTAQIAEHILGASEGRLRVDHPVISEQRAQPGSKDFGLSEELEVSMKVELAVLEGAFECFVELVAGDATQYFDGNKEVVAARD